MRQSLQQSITHFENRTAKFAMSRLDYGTPAETAAPLSAPPYEMSQEDQAYNIYFNMHGISDKNIRLGIDAEANRLTVFAERVKQTFTDQFLWVFSLPPGVNMNSMQTFYKNGVVQVMLRKEVAA